MNIQKQAIFILTLSIFIFSPLFIAGNAQAAVGKWEVYELSLTANSTYTNPYTDVTLTATFTSPSEKVIQIPGFWDGDQTWKVRMAPNEIGTWSYVTTSNPSDSGLETSSQFECVASSKKGFIQVNPSDPYKFQYTDGTPFFWMGDTCWNLFHNDIVYDGVFKDYIDRRASQHFTNIHAGLYCGDVYENEGGKPFISGDLNRLNPNYFTYVDRKVEYITSKGMVMGLFLTWAQQFVDFTTAQFERYEKYVIARYAAYNVYWVVSGEYDEAGDAYDDEFIYHGNKIDEFDPYDHPISIHTTTTNNEFGYDSWLTYIMHQKFEQDSSIMLSDLLNQLNRPDVVIVNNVSTSIADGADTLGNEGLIKGLYTEIEDDRIYSKPVVNAEFGYEQYDGWTGRTNRTTPDTVRQLAWNMVMAGGFLPMGWRRPIRHSMAAEPSAGSFPLRSWVGAIT